MILLDTQALVWIVEGSNHLGPRANQIQIGSDRVLVSAISAWELGLLVSRNKITLSRPLKEWLDVATLNGRTTIVPVTQDIAIDAGLLPNYGHGDPGDRIVLATGRSFGCPVMTSDRRMLDYAKTGHVQAIDARY